MSSDADRQLPRLWVDADACPVAIKEILFKAAQRTGIELTLIANHNMRIPKAPNIRMRTVSSGFDTSSSVIT